jgi:hypothetical protein
MVRHSRDLGEQIGNPQSAFAALLEVPVRTMQQPDVPAECVHRTFGRHWPAMPVMELRLIVKGIDLTQSTAQIDVHRTFGPRPNVRQVMGRAGSGRSGQHAVARKKLRQREAGDARAVVRQ